MKDAVISSRVRFARNIAILRFPHLESISNLTELAQKVYTVCKDYFDCNLIFMRSLDEKAKMALVEKHIVSPNLVANSRNGALIVAKDNPISVMLNEEDHIREQCILPQFDLYTAFEKLNNFDNFLLRNLPIAYDEQFGFLTSCPTNAGTGMRASVMLHLPALKQSGLLSGIVGDVAKSNGLTLRGIYGEGSQSAGGIFQLSNSISLGLSEKQILDVVSKATQDICALEKREREKLVLSAKFQDRICRSYGILSNCILIESSEFLDYISDVRLGILLDIVPKVNISMLDDLVALASTAVLSALSGTTDSEKLDFLRAELVRRLFGN